MSVFRTAAISAFVFASPIADAQVETRRLTGSDSGDFGGSVANAGDLDGDGVDELLVGEPSYDAAGNKRGRVLVFDGRTGLVRRIHVAFTRKDDYFGSSLASIGDLDADQVSDYAIGAPGSDRGRGYFFVYSGATGAQLWSDTGGGINEFLGVDVAGVGDLDGDGVPEVLASRPGLDRVDVYSGTGSLLDSVFGQSGAFFGQSITGLGDVDGDGVSDFAVGEPYFDDPAAGDVGRVRVHSGVDRSVHSEYVGQFDGNRLGMRVEIGDDYDGDAVEELLISAIEDFYTASPNQGEVRVVSAAGKLELWSHRGTQTYDYFGTSVARTGDVNCDGFRDYVVGAPGWGYGRVDVFSGIDGAFLCDVQGEQAIAFGFGTSVVGGDWNSDGLGDWVVGNPNHEDPNGIFVGAVHFFAGCPARAAPYGAGWPGTNGVPSLACLREPALGERCEVRLGNSKSGLTFGLLYLGFDEANIPTGADGTLLVLPTLAIPFYVYGASTTLWGDLPDDPSLGFLDVYLQAIEADPGASEGLSFTAGLKLTIGFDLP